MSKIKRDIAVIILNYNTAEDAVSAAKSVINSVENHSYVIALVDNKSSTVKDINILKNTHLPNVEVFSIDKNGGYAVGNNYGVRMLGEKYDFDYVLIMNPDVEVETEGTIDRLILRLSMCDNTYCGIQPMIWTPYKGDLLYQTHIRRVLSYTDVIVEQFSLFKKIFKRKFGKTEYFQERPYTKELDFEVPFGCFFIMRAKHFMEAGLLDERTFLYREEMILGCKMKHLGYKFKFLPTEKILHEGGKSIGSNAKRVKWYAVRHWINSNKIYLKYYLNCNMLEIAFVNMLTRLNFAIKYVLYILKLK